MSSEFEGRRVIVTGASAGIGAATALEFARLGARVVMVARGVERLREVIPAELADRCVPVAADVATAEGCTAAVREGVAALGGLDVLVNNAGGAKLGTSFAEGSDEWWDWHLDLNVKSVVRMTRLCIPHLKETQGCIVNLSSIAAARPVPNASAYSTAKAAVEMITKCCALEFASSGVRVVGVAPATVETQFHASAGMGADGAARYYSEASNVQVHPLGRLGTPQDIAHAVCFVASPRASWMTGTTMEVDGGRLLTMAIGKSLTQVKPASEAGAE